MVYRVLVLRCILVSRPTVQEGKREDIKEWVLAVSMDQRVEQSLPLDERDTFVGSLNCPHNGIKSVPCVVTGYPVLRHKIEFKDGKCANKEDWNKFVMASKVQIIIGQRAQII